MGSGGEIASLIVMVIGTVLTLVCVAIPFWKKNDPEDTIRDSIVRVSGCFFRKSGLHSKVFWILVGRMFTYLASLVFMLRCRFNFKSL